MQVDRFNTLGTGRAIGLIFSGVGGGGFTVAELKRVQLNFKRIIDDS